MFCPFGRDKFGRTAAAAEDLEYGDEEKQTVRVPHVLQVIRRKRLGLFGGQSSTPKQETSKQPSRHGRSTILWTVLGRSYYLKRQSHSGTTIETNNKRVTFECFTN